MGVVSPYCTDEDTVNSIRAYYGRDEQYNVNFYHWLGTARETPEGVLVTVGSRRFLLHNVLGTVIREVM